MPSLSAQMRPPCICTIRRAMVRPRPKPDSEVSQLAVPWRNGSKICSRKSGAMPVPVSSTRSSTSSSTFRDARAVPALVHQPPPVLRIALRRLRRIALLFVPRDFFMRVYDTGPADDGDERVSDLVAEDRQCLVFPAAGLLGFVLFNDQLL